MGELGSKKVVNGIAGSQRDRAGVIAGRSGTEFESGLQLAGLGEAEAVFFAEFLEVKAGEGDDATVLAKELAADLDGASSFGAGSKKNGEEFLIRKGADTQGGHFLPWFLVGRQVVDALVI